MGKIWLFLFGLLIFSSGAYALEISTELESEVIISDFANSLNFTLRVENATPGNYNLYTLSDMAISPRDAFLINSDSLEKAFTATPNENLDVEGLYVFTVTLNHRGFEKVDEKIVVKIVPLEEALEIGTEKITLDSKFAKFYVENKEDVYLKNLHADFSSILFKSEETFDLKPFEKKFFEVEVNEDDIRKTTAGVYVLEGVFDTKTGTKRIVGNLYLGETKDIKTLEEKSGFLIRTNSITKINTGNVVENVQINMGRNIFSRLFTTFNIEPVITERSGFGVDYTWIKEGLEPTQIYVVRAKTNYLIPLLIILLGALAIYSARRFFQTKVEMTKSVSHVRTKNGEFALKIKISLKAKKDVENVSIVDKIPAIVKVYKKFGTLKPDRIDSATRRIYWNIGDLNAGEERIVNYIVYSRVGVVGKFSLPEAIGVFEKEGKVHEVSSNQVFFMSDQVKGDKS